MAKTLATYDPSWRCGANFIPGNAVNQLEMWQRETFDPVTIDRELGYAEAVGMSVMRVYLHDLLYEQDAPGFMGRMETYLGIAAGHGIKTVFVFFDDCWRSEFKLGPQPPPLPYTHNSGWLQSPGVTAANDTRQWPRLKNYVQNVLRHFAADERILLWDLYNEPGNGTSGDHTTRAGLRGAEALGLLEAVFDWAAEITERRQPVTAGIWHGTAEFDALNRMMLERSEVVSFHCYNPPELLEERINFLRLAARGKAMICTEYMARPRGSTFQACLPILRKHGISAIHWGLVAGKTNTIYPWGWSAEKGEPERYFHDVFHADGTPLYADEPAVFREMTQN